MLTCIGRQVAGLVEELQDVLPRRVGDRFGEALDREYGYPDGIAEGYSLNSQIATIRTALEQVGGSVGVATGTMQSALHRASTKRGRPSQSLVL